ncbi:hypothetical protein [Methylorubrum suomiense]|uniref:Uncharacterized protein n=1 Tax=Methylorubrum suomiense TaxID=144191 RepID=A0ABQ4UYY5_9HYPH|nr:MULTISPECIES: hypothetical protein [Methylobacteriaceae]GJE77546.1 hypothetical protein BGCPKDLD_4151 [Methylorubrum suomiense]
MRRLIDWAFRDRRSGAIVVGQWPNAPLWIFLVASAAEWILEAATPGSPPWLFAGLRLVALLALAVWALDEIVRGVNPWRRFLGAAVLIGLGFSLAGRL